MSKLRLAAALLFLGSSASHAADYHAPVAFNGHPWGEPLAMLPRLTLWHANTAQGISGKVVEFNLDCVQYARGDIPSLATLCDPNLSRVTQVVEGRGSFALAEYYKDVDDSPWPGKNISLLTISYLFCAST